MGIRLRTSLIWAVLQISLQRQIATYSPPLMRIAMATVFIWFGLLKLIGRSPVADLVDQTVPYLPFELFFPALGIGEILLGLGLLCNRTICLTTVLLIVHLFIASFSVILVQPGTAFQEGNPFFPSMEGQYVIKNLVLIAAATQVRASFLRSRRGFRV